MQQRTTNHSLQRIGSLCLLVAIGLCVSVSSAMAQSINDDFDNDGVVDLIDTDDDNDGLLDVEEMCGIAPINSTSAGGLYQSTIQWLVFDSADFSDGSIDIGDSQVFTGVNGELLTLTVNSVSGQTLVVDQPIYSGGSFGSDGYVVNDGRVQIYTNNGQVGDVEFSLSAVDSGGSPIPVNLMLTDSEAAGSDERTIATTNGSVWTITEELNANGVPLHDTTGIDTNTVIIKDTAVGERTVPILRTVGVTTLSLSVGRPAGGGKSAASIGWYLERFVDTDLDTIPNRLDLDSDGDTLLDATEALVALSNRDPDQDGIPNYCEVDADDDGINDQVEAGNNLLAPLNTDRDELPDYVDLDSDNDTIDDAIEGLLDAGGNLPDTDGDLLADYRDADDFDGDLIAAGFDLDDDNDGIPNVAECSVIISNNNSFETPVHVAPPHSTPPTPTPLMSFTYASTYNDADITGWDTTAPDDAIELGRPNNQPAHDGDQYAELNANFDSRLYQDIPTTPGDTVVWSIWHRGRSDDALDFDVAQVMIGDSSGMLRVVRTMTTNNIWTNYTGSYLVPAGQTSTRFGFESVSTSSGDPAAGNFIDLFEVAACPDFDNDGYADHQDIDADNDGIPDNIEIQSTTSYIAPSGVYGSGFIDVNDDGLDDHYDATTVAGAAAGMSGTGFDFDPLLPSAHLNENTDGDTFTDSEESGIADNGSGTGDADDDGLQDRYEGTDFDDGFLVNDGIDDPASTLNNEFGDTTELAFREAMQLPTVMALSTNDTTPVINGTHTSATSLSVMVDGVTYTEGSSPELVDNGDDTWTLTLTSALNDDDYDVTATSTSASGSVSDASAAELTIDAMPPVPIIELDDVSDDNILNAAELAGTIAFTGTVVSGDFMEDDEVTLYFGGSNAFTGQVDVNGDFSIDVPGSVVASASTLTATIDTQDSLGNTVSDDFPLNYTADTTPPAPQIEIDPVTSDNILNLAEASQSLSISGAITGAGEFNAGDTVTVTINGLDYLTTVDASGVFSVDNIPGSELSQVTTIEASISTVDEAGNPGSDSTTLAYTLDVSLPEVSGVVVGSGNEAQLELSGTTNEEEGATVIVSNNTGEQVCSAVVQTEGAWACSVPNPGMIAEQSLIASITDLAGNTATAPLGVTNAYDADDDGIPDAVEGTGDTDGDGTADFRDTDSDNDGIADSVEAAVISGLPTDSDADQVPDYLDLDSDNDGIPDALESVGGFDRDTDNDGVADRIDLDSDNDGVYDAVENGADAALDTDRDGRIDGAVGDNGIVDLIETAPESAVIDVDADGVADTPVDTDGDGFIDALDTDSDGDTLTDALEAGATDTDGNGIVDDFRDNDGDGVDDAVAMVGLPDPDTNADGSPDRVDLDADGDGLGDELESGGNPAAPRDTDGDGIPDFRDTDSDDDGVQDLAELGSGGDGSLDSDADGTPDHLDNDSDNDGIPDGEETSNLDSDGDGVPDRLDVDADNDGIPDSVEGSRDSDGDGVIDRLDLDSDNDGLSDAQEAGLQGSNTLPLDSDGDGIADYRDRDSDNDGLSDTLESQGVSADSNRDGVLDSFVDNDGDGQDDGRAVLPSTPDDIDGDGLADHLDRDTDDDGQLDIVESGVTLEGGIDEDNDGAIDSMRDTDGDQIPDVVDVDVQGGADSDGDGIIDTADVDSTGGVDTDGDGIDDVSDPDANGDGMADLLSDGQGLAPLPDVNGNNIADVEEVNPPATASGIYRTGIQGGGCSIHTGAGTAGMDPVMFLLMTLSLVLLGVRRGMAKHALRHTGFVRAQRQLPTSYLSALTLCLALTAGGVSLVPSAAQAQADNSLSAQQIKAQPETQPRGKQDVGSTIKTQTSANTADEAAVQQAALKSGHTTKDRHFHRRIYLGLGLGRAWLEPDTSEVDGVAPNNRVNLGSQFTLGTDLRHWLSLELHGAILGEAGLSSGESIDYKQIGVSALLYGGGARHRFNRQGVTAFGRLGLGMLINDASDGVRYEQSNSAHVVLGAGAEYATRRGLALRAEALVFDADANYLQLGLIYRFGKRTERQRDAKLIDAPLSAEQDVTVSKVDTPAAVAETTPDEDVTEAATTGAIASRDGDRDGVSDVSDACPETRANIAVDTRGCAIFNGVLEGVTFLSGSAELSSESLSVLDQVAQSLRELPNVRFVLSAHTDSQGDEKFNQSLSGRRAFAVAKYLIGAGVEKARFTARAYGESRPIASNNTAEGRQRNRRVELRVER